MVIEIPFVMK